MRYIACIICQIQSMKVIFVNNIIIRQYGHYSSSGPKATIAPNYVLKIFAILNFLILANTNNSINSFPIVLTMLAVLFCMEKI